MARRTVITPESRPRTGPRLLPGSGDGQIILDVAMVHMALGVMILKDPQTGYPLNPEESVDPVGRDPASRYLQVRDAARNLRSTSSGD